MLCNLFAREKIQVSLPDITDGEIKEIIEMQCYKVLVEIREILADDKLDDCECFARIEKLVCVFMRALAPMAEAATILDRLLTWAVETKMTGSGAAGRELQRTSQALCPPPA